MTAGSKVGSYVTESVVLPRSLIGGSEKDAKEKSNSSSLSAFGCIKRMMIK